MKGISEEKLKEYANKLHVFNTTDRIALSALIDILIDECKELNDWMPIDENTPKDCPISLLTEYNTAVVGYFDVRDGCFWANGINRFYNITPKAWQYLPTLPKEKL